MLQGWLPALWSDPRPPSQIRGAANALSGAETHPEFKADLFRGTAFWGPGLCKRFACRNTLPPLSAADRKLDSEKGLDLARITQRGGGRDLSLETPPETQAVREGT